MRRGPAFRVSRQAARWRRHRLPRPSTGDVGTLFETRPTTRITDNVERKMAQASQEPVRVDRVRPLRLTPRTRRCTREPRTCDLDSSPIGRPRRPITGRGVADGACPDLTPPTEWKRDPAPPLERTQFARNGLRRAANDPDARSSQMRSLPPLSDPCSWFRPSVQRLRLTCGVARPLRPGRTAR